MVRKLPPEKRSSTPRRVPATSFQTCSSRSRLMPGALMCAPRRYTARMPSVNKMRRRSSGTLNILRTAAKNLSIFFPASHGCYQRISERVLLIGTNYRRDATGLFNFFARAFGEAVRGNAQRLREFSVTQDHYIVFRFFYDAAVVQQVGSHFLICLKSALKRRQAYFQPPLLENVREAAFRQATMQRHLAALKPDLGGISGARLLAFFTARRGLALARAGTATNTFLFVNRTLCGPQIIKS